MDCWHWGQQVLYPFVTRNLPPPWIWKILSRIVGSHNNQSHALNSSPFLLSCCEEWVSLRLFYFHFRIKMTVLQSWICVKTVTDDSTLTSSSGLLPALPIVNFQPHSSTLGLGFWKTQQNPDSRALIFPNYIWALTAFTFYQVPLPFSHADTFALSWVFIHSQLLRACTETIHKFINQARTIVLLPRSHHTTELHVPPCTLPLSVSYRDMKRFRFQVLESTTRFHTDCSHLFFSRFAADIVVYSKEEG